MDSKSQKRREKVDDEKLILPQLPFLVQEKICENLDGTNKRNLSNTCTFYKSMVREILGFKLHLSDSARISSRQCLQKGKSLRTVEFGRLCDDWIQSYEGKELFFDDIFVCPLALHAIYFCKTINACWIFNVLQKCRLLIRLSFHSENVGIMGDLRGFLLIEKIKEEFKQKSRSSTLTALCEDVGIMKQFYFKNLSQLNIDFRTRTLDDAEFIDVVCLIKCIRCEGLKRFLLMAIPKKATLEMEYFQLSWILAEFFEFHVKTLRDVSLGICGETPEEREKLAENWERVNSDIFAYVTSLCNQNVQSEPNEIQGHGDSIDEKRKSVEDKVKMILSLREKFESIGKISKISFLYIELPANYHWDFWHTFIENLTCLCTLRIMGSTKFNILRNCEIIRGSYKTLKRLRLNADLMNPFDLTGIENCKGLEEVYIFNAPQSSEPFNAGPNDPNVKNLHLIPPDLKSLALNNVVVNTKDLNKALAKLKKLDTLAISNMGSYNTENGSDCKSLKKIFRMRHLHTCLVFQIRCKTQITHKRVIEMLDFQFDSDLRRFSEQYFIPPFQTPLALDIISNECYRRYTWEKQKSPQFEFLSYYQFRFNDEDPHL